MNFRLFNIIESNEIFESITIDDNAFYLVNGRTIDNKPQLYLYKGRSLISFNPAIGSKTIAGLIKASNYLSISKTGIARVLKSDTLATARKIGKALFDGSKDISLDSIVGSRFGKPKEDNITIGNGVSDDILSNAVRIDMKDSKISLGAGGGYYSEGTGYGEFFEWSDGNTGSEDRIGYFVSTDSYGKIYKATQTSRNVIGVIAECGFVGNYNEDALDKWAKDEFGRIRTMEYTDSQGNVIIGRVMNPGFDNNSPYMDKKLSNKYDTVCLRGTAIVRDDGTCDPEVNCNVGTTPGIATRDIYGKWMVLERISPNLIRILL